MSEKGRDPDPRRAGDDADVSILVIEDEATNLILLRSILQECGFTVRTGSSGAEALALTRELKPDLIILDVMLPDMDGFSVCERLKLDREAQDIPVIFVTSLDDRGNKVRGLSIGGVDYITKPFDGAEIGARVRIHLRLRNANRLMLETQRRKLAALREAHHSFLTDLEAMPEAKCAVDYEAAEEAGGDQYDAIRLSSSVYGYFIADIAGHGVETAFLSSVLKALFRENASLLNSPGDAFTRINTLMKDYLSDGQHITAAYLTVNRAAATATLVSAGHLPLIVLRPDGAVSLLEAEGDVLGVFDAPRFKPSTIDAPPGTRFWLYSDGVVEDFSRGLTWRAGLTRLTEILAATATAATAAAAPPLRDTLTAAREGLYARHPGEDDRLLMVCEA